MTQLFPWYANTVVRAVLLGAFLSLGGVAWAVHTAFFSQYATGVREPVHQPVPFSHQHHVGGLGLDCRYCHTGVEKSAFAGLPPTETCMTCHSQVWRDAPVLAPVRESWATGQPLHWNRVHDLPDYVYFNHSIHVQKGIACVSCHGRLDQMPLVWKTQTLYMRWCLDCHTAPEKHLQPRQEIFAMKDHPENDAATGAALAQAYHLPPPHHLEDCSICHR